MEQTWKLSGVYFEWELTVRISAAEEPPVAIQDSDLAYAIERMRRLDEHFFDMVNMHEDGLTLNGRAG